MLVRAWHIQDAEAFAIIVGTMADEVLPHIHTTNTFFETILRDMQELNNKARILDVEIELYGTSMKEGVIVQEHIMKIKILANQLAAVD